MLIMVALFFLLAVLAPVLSAPFAAEECSSSVVLEGENVKVTTLLRNHRCSLSDLFESFFGNDDVLTSTVGDGEAHKVCVGLLELVKVGKTRNLLDDICLQATLTSPEESYCQRSIDRFAPDIKKLINLSSSLMLPDSFRSALEILSALDRENCNNICGGKKTVMCDTVVELGKAFLMDKSNIKEESSINASHPVSAAAAVNETRSPRTEDHVNSDNLPRTENSTGSSKTHFNSTKETTSKELPQITGDHIPDRRVSSQDKKVLSQNFPGGQGPSGYQLGTGQSTSYQQDSNPNQKLSSTYPTRHNQNFPGQPAGNPAGRNPNIPGQTNWYPTGRNPGQPNWYPTGRNPNVPGQPNWYPTGRNLNVPGQPNWYPTGRNPNIPGQTNWYPTGRNPNLSYPTGRNPGQTNWYPTGRNPNIPGQPNLYPTERNQPLQYPAGHNRNIPGQPFQYPAGRKQNISGQPARYPSEQTQNQKTPGGPTLYPGESSPNRDTPVGSSPDPTSNFMNPKIPEGSVHNQKFPLEPSGPQNQEHNEDIVRNRFNKTQFVHLHLDPENKEAITLDLGGEKSSTQKGEELDESGKKFPGKAESEAKPSDTEANDLQENLKNDNLVSNSNGNGEKQSSDEIVKQNNKSKDGKKKNEDDGVVTIKKEHTDDVLNSFSEGAEANPMNTAPEEENNLDSSQNFDPFPNDESEKKNEESQQHFAIESVGEKMKFHVESDTPFTQPTSQKSTSTTTEEISLDDEYHGYGTWHFVSIFLIISVIAIVGYFFVHNRKKLRESLTGQIAGKGRRKNNYRPLSQQ